MPPPIGEADTTTHGSSSGDGVVMEEVGNMPMMTVAEQEGEAVSSAPLFMLQITNKIYKLYTIYISCGGADIRRGGGGGNNVHFGMLVSDKPI